MLLWDILKPEDKVKLVWAQWHWFGLKLSVPLPDKRLVKIILSPKIESTTELDRLMRQKPGYKEGPLK